MVKKILTILEVIEKSSEYLKKKGVPSAKCDVEWIVSSVLKRPRMELFLNYEEVLPQKPLDQIRQLVLSRGKRVPLQHLLGTVQFGGLSLISDSRALIPRPETERLVEILVNRLSESFKGSIFDLGTGSGAIVLSLCHSLPNSKGFGLEKCKRALSLANENILHCKMENRVKALHYDWEVDKLPEIEIGLIVSNPPYLDITEWESAETEVKQYDPLGALVSKNQGTFDFLQIINLASAKLSKGGILALEFGASHADVALNAMKVLFDVEILKDYNQCRRYAFGTKR